MNIYTTTNGTFYVSDDHLSDYDRARRKYFQSLLGPNFMGTGRVTVTKKPEPASLLDELEPERMELG